MPDCNLLHFKLHNQNSNVVIQTTCPMNGKRTEYADELGWVNSRGFVWELIKELLVGMWVTRSSSFKGKYKNNPFRSQEWNGPQWIKVKGLTVHTFRKRRGFVCSLFKKEVKWSLPLMERGIWGNKSTWIYAVKSEIWTTPSDCFRWPGFREIQNYKRETCKKVLPLR